MLKGLSDTRTAIHEKEKEEMQDQSQPSSRHEFNDQFLQYLRNREQSIRETMEPKRNIIQRNPHYENPAPEVLHVPERRNYRLTEYSDTSTDEEITTSEGDHTEDFVIVSETDWITSDNIEEKIEINAEEAIESIDTDDKKECLLSNGEKTPLGQDKYEWVEEKLRQIEGIDENTEEQFEFIEETVEEVIMESEYTLSENPFEGVEDHNNNTEHQAQDIVKLCDLGEEENELFESQYEVMADNLVTSEVTSRDQSTLDATNPNSLFENKIVTKKRYITEEGKYLYVEENNETNTKSIKNQSECNLHEDQNMTDSQNITEEHNIIDEQGYTDKQYISENPITEDESMADDNNVEWPEQNAIEQQNYLADGKFIENNTLLKDQSCIDIQNVIEVQNTTEYKLFSKQINAKVEQEASDGGNPCNLAPVFIDVNETPRATTIVTLPIKTSPAAALTAGMNEASIPQVHQSASITGQTPSDLQYNGRGDNNNNEPGVQILDYHEPLTPPAADSRSRGQPQIMSPTIDGEDIIRNWPIVNVLYQIKELAMNSLISYNENRSTDIQPLDLSTRKQEELFSKLPDGIFNNTKDSSRIFNQLINSEVKKDKNIHSSTKPKLMRKLKKLDNRKTGSCKTKRQEKNQRRIFGKLKMDNDQGTSSIKTPEISDVLKDIFKTVQQTKIDKEKICDVFTETINVTFDKAVQTVSRLFTQGTQTDEPMPKPCTKKHVAEPHFAGKSKEKINLRREMESGSFIIFLIRLANWLLRLNISMHDMIRMLFNVGVMKLGLMCGNRQNLDEITHLIVIEPLNEDVEKKILEALKPISEIFTPKKHCSNEEEVNSQKATETNQTNVQNLTEDSTHEATLLHGFMATLASKQNKTKDENLNCSAQVSMVHNEGASDIAESLKTKKDETPTVATTNAAKQESERQVILLNLGSAANQIQPNQLREWCQPEELPTILQATMPPQTRQQVSLSTSAPTASATLSDALPMTIPNSYFKNTTTNKNILEIITVSPPSHFLTNEAGGLTIQKRYRATTETSQAHSKNLLCTKEAPKNNASGNNFFDSNPYFPTSFETIPGRPVCCNKWKSQAKEMQKNSHAPSASRSSFERTADNAIGFVPGAVQPLMPSAPTVCENRDQRRHQSLQPNMAPRFPYYGAPGQPIHNEMMMTPGMHYHLQIQQQYSEFLANQARGRGFSTATPLAGPSTMNSVPPSSVAPLTVPPMITRANFPSTMAQAPIPPRTPFTTNYRPQQNFNARHVNPYYNRGNHNYNPYRPSDDSEKKKRNYKRTMN